MEASSDSEEVVEKSVRTASDGGEVVEKSGNTESMAEAEVTIAEVEVKNRNSGLSQQGVLRHSSPTL